MPGKSVALLYCIYCLCSISCVEDDLIGLDDECKMLKIESINFPNSTKDKLAFSYDKRGRLIHLENWPHDEFFTDFIYDVKNQLTAFETYNKIDRQLSTMNYLEYGIHGKVSCITRYVQDSSAKFTPNQSKQFVYNLGGQLSEYKILSLNRQSIDETHIFVWENGNVVREDVYLESKHAYIVQSEYDELPNFMNGSVHFFLESPSNWTANNLISFHPIDLLGYIDFFCDPCEFEYEYHNFCDRPTRRHYLPFNSVFEIEYGY